MKNLPVLAEYLEATSTMLEASDDVSFIGNHEFVSRLTLSMKARVPLSSHHVPKAILIVVDTR